MLSPERNDVAKKQTGGPSDEPATAPTDGVNDGSSPWVLAATILASSMAFIDGTVVNIALPAMQKDYDVGLEQIQWVIESYSLFLSALILLGGSLGDRFGRRRIFLVGTWSFSTASVFCAIAPNLMTLNVARSLQGVGAALLVPSSLAVISASFPANRRGAAIGTWTAFSALTTALGPPIGGLAVEYGSWRWVFLINAPLAVIVWWIARRKVKESFGRSGDRIDWIGAFLITTSLGSLIYGMIAWGEGHSGVAVWGPLLIGALLMGAFLLAEATSRNAMLPLHFFRNRTFSAVNAMTLLLYAALSGLLYFLPFNLIHVQGWPAWLAGAAFLPFSAVMFLLARLGGAMADAHGPRVPLAFGATLTGFGFAGFAFLPNVIPHYFAAIAAATFVMAVGMSLVVPPLTTVAMTSVEEGFAGVASGINNAVARLAGLIGVAIFTVIALRVFSPGFTQALAASTLPSEVVETLRAQSTKLSGMELPNTWSTQVREEAERVIKIAFTRAFAWTCYAAAGLVWVAAICAAVGVRQTSKSVPS